MLSRRDLRWPPPTGKSVSDRRILPWGPMRQGSQEQFRKELDLQRQEGLRLRGAASEDELAQARTAQTLARAEEQLRQTRLAFTHIRAPFFGVVTDLT